MTYTRRGNLGGGGSGASAKQPEVAKPAKDGPPPGSVAVNGFQQVLDMLRVADPIFREATLRRLEKADPRLAMNLRRQLAPR